MPATAEPPAAPPAAAPAPAAMPPISAPPTDFARVPSPSDAPKPGSARERMLKETSNKWGAAEAPKPGEPAKPAEAPKPADATPPARPGDAPAEEGATPPADITPEQKKQNPWKLYREVKAQNEVLERKLAESGKSPMAETEKAEYLARIEKAEARIKAHEDELRFKAYEKSEEFKSKYDAPYNEAWQKHMNDLRGISITGEDGQTRPMEVKDILDLVNLELGDARDLADTKWGKFASDAMQARKEIRDLFHARSKALEEARKTGEEREKQTTERQLKWKVDTDKHIKTTWETANQAALADPNNGEFFKPAEGDETRNQLLGKGFALVDKAFAENPMDPRLTPEQRAEIVKRHAAVRNRAAAFGPMKYIISKLKAKLAELEKANGQFKDSTPPTAGGTAAPSGQGPTSGRAKMYAAQEKFSK